MRRGLALLIGLGIASVAAYALLTGARPLAGGEGGTAGTLPAERHGAPQPHGEIDTETQDQLKEILRAADREDHE